MYLYHIFTKINIYLPEYRLSKNNNLEKMIMLVYFFLFIFLLINYISCVCKCKQFLHRYVVIDLRVHKNLNDILQQ
jgi:hypothetical protein